MIKELPDRLREQREINGLSQRGVAKRLNVSPSIISGYETGERTPSVENLLALSYLYRCSTDYLLGKETPKVNTLVNVGDLTDNQMRLIRELIDDMRSRP